MPNTDMTFCFGPVRGCPYEKECARFLAGAKLPKGNFYIQDFLAQSIGLQGCKFFKPRDKEDNNGKI